MSRPGNQGIARRRTSVGESFKNQHFSIEVIAQDDLVINGYQNEYAQVIINILNNARDVLTERKIKSPKVMITISSKGSRFVVTISDNAGGIPEEILD